MSPRGRASGLVTMPIDDRTFVDTNVLVYAHDASDPRKQARALEVLDGLARVGTAYVSTQVLGEFARVVTSRIPEPLSHEEAASQVHAAITAFGVLAIDSRTVAEALRGQVVHRMPYWDAQIWAAARLEHIPVVLSEDFQHASEIEGVRFENPFLRE